LIRGADASTAARRTYRRVMANPTKLRLPAAAEALPGRATPLPVADHHFVSGHALLPPYPAGLELALFGMGCFWGAEKKFWARPGGACGGHGADRRARGAARQREAMPSRTSTAPECSCGQDHRQPNLAKTRGG